MNKTPAFFKFFIAEINGIDMKIPIAFIRRMEQALPEKVLFRDRNNKKWSIKVAKVGDCWYFVDGWDKFVDDNLLTTGDVMVFEYFRKSVFDVKLFGSSATEKNVVGPSTLKGVEKQEPIKEYDDIDHDNEDDKDEENEDGSNVQMTRQEREHREVFQEQVINNDGAAVGRNSTRGRLTYLYPRCYGMEIFEAGLAMQPRNPYFVAKIMPKRKSDLFIPQDVIKDYSLNLGNEIILVDPNGREFRTKCRKWKDGRSILSGGWRRLCRVNLVALEDSCICEFVPREGDQRQFLHVTFVRGNIMEN